MERLTFLQITQGAADPAQHKILASMLQGLGTFKNIRAAPGPQGKIHSVIVESVGKDGDIDAAEAYISEDWDTLAPFPYSESPCAAGLNSPGITF